MKLFELDASGPEASDCTTPYYVVFHGPPYKCTVREFIKTVLTRNEWGYIRISSYFDKLQIEYRYDKIVSVYGAFSLDILNARIKNVTAHGGCTRMDYTLDVRTNEQKLRNEYAQTLEEITRHESEITELKKKAHDLEGQFESKPQLDKDGCVYWDSVLK